MPEWQENLSRDGRAVWQTAYRLVGNRADADECFQEAFLAALEVPRLEEIQHWRALAQRLATARAVDCLRFRRRQAALRQAAAVDDLPSSRPTPSQAAEDAELDCNSTGGGERRIRRSCPEASQRAHAGLPPHHRISRPGETAGDQSRARSVLDDRSVGFFPAAGPLAVWSEPPCWGNPPASTGHSISAGSSAMRTSENFDAKVRILLTFQWHM
jgi:DNA-directed RNA polymerase specialized sigma24 family protein